jgi:hypothetical protein
MQFKMSDQALRTFSSLYRNACDHLDGTASFGIIRIIFVSNSHLTVHYPLKADLFRFVCGTSSSHKVIVDSAVSIYFRIEDNSSAIPAPPFAIAYVQPYANHRMKVPERKSCSLSIVNSFKAWLNVRPVPFTGQFPLLVTSYCINKTQPVSIFPERILLRPT